MMEELKNLGIEMLSGVKDNFDDSLGDAILAMGAGGRFEDECAELFF